MKEGGLAAMQLRQCCLSKSDLKMRQFYAVLVVENLVGSGLGWSRQEQPVLVSRILPWVGSAVLVCTWPDISKISTRLWMACPRLAARVFLPQSLSSRQGVRTGATPNVCQTEVGVSPGGDIHFLEQQHNQEPFQFVEGDGFLVERRLCNL